MSGSVGDNTARASGVIKAAGGGKVLQVVQGTKTNTGSVSSATFAEITGNDKAITPKAEGSSFLVQWAISMCNYQIIALFLDIDGAGYNQLTDFCANTAGSRPRCSSYSSSSDPGVLSGNALVTPTYSLTDVLTYQIRFVAHTSSTSYQNRNSGDGDNYYTGRSFSSITITEIAAD